MNLGGLIWVALSSVIVAGFAPAPTQPPVTGPPAPVPQACNHSSSGNDFISAKVFFLSPAFNPKSGATPSSSEIIRHVLPTDLYWNDLIGAFNTAPDFFKDKLCSLDGIFVVQNTCAPADSTVDDVIDRSWGFRQQIAPPKRYITIFNASNFYSGTFYTNTGWPNGAVPSGRRVDFGEQLLNQQLKPDYAATLQSHLSHANYLQAGGGLRSIFQDTEAAGTLATFSPVEDFVDAYEWHVLLSANPPLTDLTIQIPGLPALRDRARHRHEPALGESWLVSDGRRPGICEHRRA